MILQHLFMLLIIIVVIWILVRICILQPLGIEGQNFRSFFSGLFRFVRWVLEVLWLLVKAMWYMVKYLLIKPISYLFKVLYRTIKFFLIKKR